MSGWIGVDLDGTLAHYDGWKGIEHVGPPVTRMVSRVKDWLAKGHEVRIFTARVSIRDDAEVKRIVKVIHDWLAESGLPPLQVTCMKDFGMVELYDDRCVQVVHNTGILVTYIPPAPMSEGNG